MKKRSLGFGVSGRALPAEDGILHPQVVWCFVFGVWCLVFGVWCLGSGVWGLGLRLRVEGSGFRA